MIVLLKMVLSANFWVGAIIGSLLTYVFYPLMQSSLDKLFKITK
jgi:hypothetical protein